MFALNFLTVEVRTVLALQILDEGFAFTQPNYAMTPTDRVALGTKLALFAATNHKLFVGNFEFSAGALPVEHYQPCKHNAPFAQFPMGIPTTV
jgi:hypothetical protein